ncbi:BMP family ABC transporter substrate-binding protein [Bacillus suaedae]|uniref:BMP family ABC transporter substrate-binding protein n=1 Tax=Halalkalibacter suaedae TaxID=2822140 RepID=A0A940WNM3_9BACI|nr:BMP family ABC transporter substrate-binding protein [Bacillus suaedae]MBP3949561.1 BMP family ABC transporter substrate-binding protein [Bacillus suaedae]
MKLHHFFYSILIIVMLISGCSPSLESGTSPKIGLLLEGTIDDQGWNSKGYQGLLNIHANLNVEVAFKEDIDTEVKVEKAVTEFNEAGITLIFGHGRFFAEPFTNLGKVYEDVHFVSFNGHVEGNNVTSLHFDGYAMGFFAGMLASTMSGSEKVGIIAAFPWQSEVEGYYEGASLNPETDVTINYVEDWTNAEKAVTFFDDMIGKGVDVVYPAGDGYHVQVIEKAKEAGIFAIGYVGDQVDLGEATVLTSTVQEVDKLYEKIAEQYSKGELKEGNFVYDFQDGVISLGNFGSEVPTKVRTQLAEHIREYIQTGDLPTSPIM